MLPDAASAWLAVLTGSLTLVSFLMALLARRRPEKFSPPPPEPRLLVPIVRPIAWHPEQDEPSRDRRLSRQLEEIQSQANRRADVAARSLAQIEHDLADVKSAVRGPIWKGLSIFFCGSFVSALISWLVQDGMQHLARQ